VGESFEPKIVGEGTAFPCILLGLHFNHWLTASLKS